MYAKDDVYHMEHSERKRNRLRNFDYGQAESYFVTLCTHNRIRLFHIDPPVGNDLVSFPALQTAETVIKSSANGSVKQRTSFQIL